MAKQKQQRTTKQQQNQPRRRKGKVEITFDAEARREFLSGFSKRKQERRIYGLAHQKLKDRKAKLEQRAARKSEAQLRDDLIPDTSTDNAIEESRVYQDTTTQLQWGGDVVVRISTNIPKYEEDLEDTTPSSSAKKADVDQEYAGNIQKYVDRLKGNLPSKKKSQASRKKRKGQHGALAGVNAGDFKTAQKMLGQATNKRQKRR